jgi:cell division protein FtsX
VNVATFLLSRSSARSRETSVRVAIGATRRQLAAQVVTDSALISLAGAACGLLLARWTLDIIPSLLFERDAEHLVLAPDTRGIVTAAVACAMATIACGMMPLLEMRHDDPSAVLRRESAGPSRLMQRVRAALVIAQTTCCCLLIVSMLALMTGFRAALETGVGRQLHGSILATVQPQFRFERPDLGFRYYRDIETAAMSVPAITTAAWSSLPPGSRPGWQAVRVEPPQLPVRDVVMDVAAFTPQSVRTVVTPPIAGRMFTASDRPESCRVAIVNDVAARELFDGDAVARAIEGPTGQRVEIIGVVTERQQSQQAGPGTPRIYYYAEQGGPPLDHLGPARFRVPERQTDASRVLETLVVSSGYFTALAVSPVAGRVFEQEPAGGDCRVGVINEEAAQLYFGGNAVGGALIDGAGNRTDVIGVVHVPAMRVAQRRPEAAIYLPLSQHFVPRMTLILGARDASDRPDAVVRSVRTQLDQVKGGFNSPFVTTLDAHLRAIALAPQRIAVVLVSASAVTALALAVLGLYGAMSDAARHRRREIAVRLALGAQAWRVLRQVLWEGARLALTGALAGTIGALLVIRLLARVTPEAGLPSLWAWLFAPVVLLAAVAIASVLPARQALSTDPLAVMQRE